MGLASAAGFAAIDLRYGLTRRIRSVYLLDGLAQLAFIRTGIGSAPVKCRDLRNSHTRASR